MRTRIAESLARRLSGVREGSKVRGPILDADSHVVVAPQAGEEALPIIAVRLGRLLVRARRGEDLLHTLHLFGAMGITAFGWAVCRLIGVSAEPWLPLWFFAAVFVYNIDRLRHDPADEVNLPQRTGVARRLRWVSLLLAAGAGVLLLAVPIVQQDWLSLALIVLGTPLCLSYTIPFRGRRLKDVPYLKTFFAPTVVVLAVFGLPLLHEPRRFDFLETPLLIVWAWGLLFANMVLCDVRDIPGDVRTGVTSLPSRIGLRSTRRLLLALAVGIGGLAAEMIFLGTNATRGVWIALSMVPTVYLGALAVLITWPRSERFFERWVEGILFLPALLVAFFL